MLRKIVIGSSAVLFSGMALSSGPAEAVVVTVRGQLWNVSTTGASAIPPDDAFQWTPWFESHDFGELAAEFAEEVGPALGLPNQSAGPYFLFEDIQGGDGGNYYTAWNSYAYVGDGAGGGEVRFVQHYTWEGWSSNNDYPKVWATATRVPGPLPILGVAAGFGASRRLRKRLKTSSILFARSSDLPVR